VARNEAFIAAPLERVFGVLSDPRSYGDWVPGSKAIRAADPDWPAPGTGFDHTLVIGLADHTSVCSALAPVMLELRARARPLGSADVALHLQPEAEGTRVTMIEDPANRALSVLIGPLGHGLIKLRNVEALRRLKRLAEEDAPSAPAELPPRGG
jgi:Polyketide cyclase / dehydrase and lipid transport